MELNEHQINGINTELDRLGYEPKSPFRKVWFDHLTWIVRYSIFLGLPYAGELWKDFTNGLIKAGYSQEAFEEWLLQINEEVNYTYL